MTIVEIKNPCSCFLKSGLPERQQFADKNDAKEEAEQLLDQMQRTFCKKHEFSLSESFGKYTIFIRPRQS